MFLCNSLVAKNNFYDIIMLLNNACDASVNKNINLVIIFVNLFIKKIFEIKFFLI